MAFILRVLGKWIFISIQLKFLIIMGNQITHNSLTDYIESQDLLSAVQLLQQGADPNSVSSQGKSCLRLALEQGNSQIYRILHQIGGEIIPPLELETPLHYAARAGHTKLVRMFLRNSKIFPSYKNSKDFNGRTPLHLATISGHSEIVALLLKYNCSSDLKDSQNKTAKDLALEHDHLTQNEILELLSSEELIVKTPKAGIQASKSPHLRRISSKSTHFSSMAENENNLLTLEVLSNDNMVPLIPSSDLKFGEIINRGSSCIVFKGLWRGTPVAIKQFKLEYSTSPKELEKFIKEMNILAKVRHPNLILLMGICIDQPNLCIISELIANCSLFQAIHKNGKTLTMENRFRIAYQLALGLQYLHKSNPPIIHRDLKPENVLVRTM